MNRWSFPVAALLALFLSAPALAQTCQTYAGLTYGTYVDGSGAHAGLEPLRPRLCRGAGSDESRFLGGPIQDRPELAATANPISYVDEEDPPLLVMHGTLDKLIPFNQSQLLVDAARAAGDEERQADREPVTARPTGGSGGGALIQPAAGRASGLVQATLKRGSPNDPPRRPAQDTPG